MEEELERLRLLAEQVNAANDLADIYSRLGGIIDQQNQSISGFVSAQKESIRLRIQETTLTRTIDQLIDEIANGERAIVGLQGEALEIAQANIGLLQRKVATLRETLNSTREERAALEDNSNILAAIGNELVSQLKSWAEQEFAISSIWQYLQQIDGAIRTTQLNLGVSGNKAQMMRQQFEGAVNAAQRYGAAAKDIAELQEGMAEASGRVAAYTSNELISLVQITKGTGLQNAEVSKLVGSMQKFGLSVESSKNLIEESVNSSAKLGISSNAVLKKLAANIDKINGYRFDKGIKGIEEMAKASEKFRFSMDGAFAAADKFSTLEGLLEAGANLRVLGGEFAKMDEFKLSFLARNKPQEFATEMAKLTKGMATFNKETGEFDVSDVNYDILRASAKETGRDINDVVQQAKTFNQIEFAKKQIFGNIDPADKEMIASLATFKPGSTIGTIQIGDKNVKLNELTETQVSLLKQEQQTLKQRAEESQNFDQTFQNTVMQLKSTLLPLLSYINKGLEWFSGLVDKFRDSSGALSASAALVPIGGLLLGTAGGAIIMGLTRGLFGLIGSGIGRMFGGIGGTLGGGGAGGVGLLRASLGTLTGIGIAAVGVGAGLYLAAKGATSLALAFKGMTAGEFTAFALTLGALSFGMAAIISLAPAAGAAAGPLIEFGAAVALIGAGIGIAGLGIAEIFKAINNSTENINFTGLEALGGVDFKNMDKLKVLQNFKQSDVNRMNEMFDILNQINSIDTSKLDSLQKLFTNSTLKVQLEGNPTINNVITIDIDRELSATINRRIEKQVPIIIKKGTMPK
jgi:hypothetical protein